MTESIFGRMRRVVSAKAECAVDALERASGESLIRHSVREVGEAADRLRERQVRAQDKARADEARAQALAGRIADAGEQARYALSKQREDLAEAAVVRQLALEAEARRVKAAAAEAAREARDLEPQIAALLTRKRQMETEAAATSSPAPKPASDPRTARTVERAEAAFARAMAAAGAVPAAASAAAGLAEIDRLRQEEEIAARLAALRDGKAQEKKRRRAG